MPTRQRTRDQERLERIARERHLRAELNAERARERKEAIRTAELAEPPPF